MQKVKSSKSLPSLSRDKKTNSYMEFNEDCIQVKNSIDIALNIFHEKAQAFTSKAENLNEKYIMEHYNSIKFDKNGWSLGGEADSCENTPCPSPKLERRKSKKSSLKKKSKEKDNTKSVSYDTIMEDEEYPRMLLGYDSSRANTQESLNGASARSTPYASRENLDRSDPMDIPKARKSLRAGAF